MQIGKVLFGDFAILHIAEDKIREVIADLGFPQVFRVPIFFTLLGRASLEASGITQVQNQPFLDLKGRGVLVRFYRYRNRLQKLRIPI
ncbi:MAG: hypothetical protein FWC79_02080 [Oscillospiraceae bacterium]|nr:hypothetical protein [Oscillospiraceae bacterium]